MQEDTSQSDSSNAMQVYPDETHQTPLNHHLEQRMIMLENQLHTLNTIISQQCQRRILALQEGTVQLQDICNQCGVQKNNCKSPLGTEWLIVEHYNKKVPMCPTCTWLNKHKLKKHQELLFHYGLHYAD